MTKFKLVSKYQPTGDQPAAIRQLVDGVNKGVHEQTLLGVTGSGKTFTMANIIEQTQRPTLILAHNKTLAAQLYSEFREFFPENEVHYFVSYFDYYQPEAYIASTDTYIEKDSAINDEIDRLRHGATEALLTRRDVIVVSSVSCIYGIGSPAHYEEMSLPMWRDKNGWTIVNKEFEELPEVTTEDEGASPVTTGASDPSPEKSCSNFFVARDKVNATKSLASANGALISESLDKSEMNSAFGCSIINAISSSTMVSALTPVFKSSFRSLVILFISPDT